MLYRNLILIVLIFPICYIHSQSRSNIKPTGDAVYENFIRFLDYFENITIKDTSNEANEIPFSIFQCVIGNQCIAEYGNKNSDIKIFPLQLLNKGYNVTLLYKIIYSTSSSNASDYCIATLSEDGILKKSNIIGNNSTISKIVNACNVNVYNDVLLESIQLLLIADEKREVVRKIEYSYYVFDNKGFEMLYPEYSKGRKFPISSLRIMNNNEIEIYTFEQLEVMKNEIYAEYGYIFEDKKWNEYFNKQSWYYPSPENNIIDRLTPIEKINIEKIQTYLELK